jgi:hypothetical protein
MNANNANKKIGQLIAGLGCSQVLTGLIMALIKS